MPDLIRHLELKRALDELAAVEDRLLAHERELFRALRAKYEVPADGDFDDLHCLEVMLRNVEIREGFVDEPDPGGPHRRSIERRGGPDG